MAYLLEIHGLVPLDPATLKDAAAELSPKERPDGALILRIGRAEATLRAQAGERGGTVLLELPFGAPPEEAGEGLEVGLRLASRLGGRVVDPQLGREVSAGDRPSVERQFAEASSWSVRYAGISEDPRSVGAETVIPREETRVPGRVLLAVAGLFLLVLLALRVVGSVFEPPTQAPSYAESPDGGP